MMGTERTAPPLYGLGKTDMGDIIHGSATDAALGVLLPSLPGDSPAVVLLRKTVAEFERTGMEKEVLVALALNLTAQLAIGLVDDGAPRGKVVNALPSELRTRLQKVLPFKTVEASSP